MKVWEKYYQKGLRSMSWMGKKWRTMWEEFVRTGECPNAMPCRFCPFFPDEYPCKFGVSREIIIEELNKEVEK